MKLNLNPFLWVFWSSNDYFLFLLLYIYIGLIETISNYKLGNENIRE